MIRVAIVEDDAESAKIIAECVLKFGRENGKTFDIKTYADGLDFLEQYQGSEVVFMDIEMPYMDGIEVSKRLRERDKSVCLVFITNMAQLAIKGYSVDALNFLIKPVEYEDLSYCLKKIEALLERNRFNFICLDTRTGLVTLNLNDIYYLEICKHNVIYHTSSGNYEVRESLLEAENKLIAGGSFARPYNAFSVNLNYVDQIKDDGVYVRGEWIPLSRGKKKEFLDALTKFIGQGGRRCL